MMTKFYRKTEKSFCPCTEEQAEYALIDIGEYMELIDAAARVERADGVLRIQRERANADRGITPKKARSGYVAKDWRNKIIRSNGHDIDVIQIRLQTPYSVADYHQMTDVEKLTKNDLSVILGITAWENVKSNRSLIPDIGYSFSCIFTGEKYWAVEFILARKTASANEIPEDFLK